MSRDCAPLRRCVRAGSALALSLVLAGCRGATLHPVDGRVLLKGKPFLGKEGAVVLKPDPDKGNRSAVPSVGVLGRDGNFSLQTDGKPGARPGWYKVTVLATEPDANPNEGSRRLLNARYESAATTPLALEVVPNPEPGSYDLKLSP